VFVGTNKTATSTDDITFADNGDGTTITYHARVVSTDWRSSPTRS
jgi:hypothetical protein